MSPVLPKKGWLRNTEIKEIFLYCNIFYLLFLDGNPGGKPGKSAGGGSFPRAGKRREQTNASFAATNPRRPPPFSAGGVSQRRCPPAQSQRWNWNSAPAAAAVDEADEFEVGSLYKAGSKKQSLNHLLSFQFAPRPGGTDARGGGSAVRHNGKFRRPQQPGGQVSARYRKEHYLQANCQFVVRVAGDYSRHEDDPDLLVDWGLIEQVRLRTSGSEPTSCPICLFPPTAAKISRCGHVFCWPCILHYLGKDVSSCNLFFLLIVHRNRIRYIIRFRKHCFLRRI